MKSKILLLGHKSFPSGCLEATSIILGKEVEEIIDFIEISQDLDSEKLENLIHNKIIFYKDSHKLYILCDLFGGSAANLALKYTGDSSVEIFCGYNLPILLKLSEEILKEGEYKEDFSRIQSYGAENLIYANGILNKRGN